MKHSRSMLKKCSWRILLWIFKVQKGRSYFLFSELYATVVLLCMSLKVLFIALKFYFYFLSYEVLFNLNIIIT